MLNGRERLIYGGLSVAMRQNVVSRAVQARQRLSWSVRQMEAWRLDRLRSLLIHASSNVPVYRDRIGAAGLDPRSLSAFTELELLPILSRNDLREHGERLVDERIDPASLERMSTGGTTGTPVSVLLDPANTLNRMLVVHRMYWQMGRSLGSPTLMLAGSPIDARRWSSARDRIKNRFFGITVRPAFDLRPETIEQTLADISAGRFGWIIAYASVFDLLCAAVGKNFRRPKRISIIPCAEMVTPAQRERWANVLGAEVFEVYGSREANGIAGETPDHRSLVVNGDLYHVEITDAQGGLLPMGEPGLITLTTLHEYGMPLIRYQLGDMGVLEDRSEGDFSPFPRLRITHGRVLDIIYLPDGRMLPGEYFPHLMKEVHTQVRRFQVVQRAIDQLEVRIVATEAYNEDTRTFLVDRLRKQLGEGMRVQLVRVEQIETSASGKYRPTINLIPLAERPGSRSSAHV